MIGAKSIFLLVSRLINSLLDTSLFTFLHNDITMYCFVYVDEIIIIKNHSTKVQKFIKQLVVYFSFKDFRPLSYFLGVKITQLSKGLPLTQQRYIKYFHIRYNMLHATSLMLSTIVLLVSSGTPFDYPTKMCPLHGWTLFLMLISCPNSCIVLHLIIGSRQLHPSLS